MTTITPTEARRNLLRILDGLAESHEPVRIAGRGRSAVLVPEEEWSAIQETLFLDSIPGMKESILEGAAEPLDECSEDPGW